MRTADEEAGGAKMSSAAQPAMSNRARSGKNRKHAAARSCRPSRLSITSSSGKAFTITNVVSSVSGLNVQTIPKPDGKGYDIVALTASCGLMLGAAERPPQ